MPLRLAALCLALLIAAAPARADTAGATPSTWTLEVDSKNTCTGTKVSYNHTDTHAGSVTFQMPEVSGKIAGKGGAFSYHTAGQTMGNPWSFTAKGSFSVTGTVNPGHLRFTPRVRLADGTDFFQPVQTFEMPIYDGATFETEPASNAEVSCKGYVRYTLRGKPREKYRVTVDDRLLWAKDHGVFSGHTYRTALTVQVLTEVEITVEDEKIKGVSGTRRLGRVTPSGRPPGVWTIAERKGTCPGNPRSYPYAPPLSNSQISASVRDSATLALAVAAGEAGAAVEWKIDPKAAKQISPDIQFGKPEQFNGDWCADLYLNVTGWSFARRRNSTTVTEDTFDHLQILQVTQLDTASSPAPGQTTGQIPPAKHFQGDRAP